MKRLTKFIEKNISGKKVLGFFILTNVVYIFMLTVTIPEKISHFDYDSNMKVIKVTQNGAIRLVYLEN